MNALGTGAFQVPAEATKSIPPDAEGVFDAIALASRNRARARGGIVPGLKPVTSCP
jgi:hypothetical protein